MNYNETLDFLFNALPMFQRIGAAAFKKDLSNTRALCAHLGNPQQRFKSIHIAGTNGKGSTAHGLASVLQEAGFKIGLYTSPHLSSFRERIKINGEEIPEATVVAFVQENKPFLEELKPSFFEMTVALAFLHFAEQKVDYAVVEVGMGGKFDSTNILSPELCIITNIGLDHVQFLGDTLPKIATEKAGIIKRNIPVIIGETQKETLQVFKKTAEELDAPIFFADQQIKVKLKSTKPDHLNQLQEFEIIIGDNSETIQMDLLGRYQGKNLPAILMALHLMRQKGISIEMGAVKRGLRSIVRNTGLKGRWQILSIDPLTICDTGHNVEGIKVIIEQLQQIPYRQLFLILGMVNDKDLKQVLSLLPLNAHYVFCQAKIPRALPAGDLYQLAKQIGLEGEVIPDVNEALEAVRNKSGKGDLIFIGGSTFVVAELKEL